MSFNVIPLLPPQLAQAVHDELAHRRGAVANQELQTCKTSNDIACGIAPFALPTFASNEKYKTSLSDPSPMKLWDVSQKKLVIESVNGNYRDFGPDSSATTCFRNMKNVDSFCRNTLKRLPVEVGNTNLMNVYIHDARVYDNAFWHPEYHSVFFGGYTKGVFTPFDESSDILTHEFGHAITQATCQLEYEGQSGALNESYSDVIAILQKHQTAKTDANSPDANWLIADGLILNDHARGALRSMDAEPAFDHPILKKDGQAKHMNAYVKTEDDHGGVHSNSGIPNHAFYLAAKKIGGGSWEKTGEIWHQAHISSGSADNFVTFANRMIKTAKQLHGEVVSGLVASAWADVGVDLRAAPKTQASTPPSNSTWNYRKSLLAVSAVALAGAAWYIAANRTNNVNSNSV